MKKLIYLSAAFFFLSSCNGQQDSASEPAPAGRAKVLSVSAGGDPQAYTFSVEVKSPDTGCDQYADWWEVISEDGELLYRRVLQHSHVNEQPFTRSGGPVPVGAETFVWVRAHMNNSGYGTKVMGGTVKSGFQADSLAADFAKELAMKQPLPDGCAF